MQLNKIYCKSCLNMKEVNDRSIDMILTDPPWFVSKEIKIHRSMNPKKYKYIGKDISLDFGDWDHFKNEDEYLEFTKNWMTECNRVLRKGGHLITFFDLMRITYLVNIAKELNWLPRQVLFWRKTNPVPRARKIDFMIALEAAPWFTKETKAKKFATFNHELGQQKNVVDSAIPGHTTKQDGPRVHPTQKPIKVLQTWILYLTNPGDIVLDLFAGSGATLKAAKRQERHYIGYENNPHYYKIIKNGLEAERTLWDITKEKEKIIGKVINNKLDSGVLL